MYVITGASGNTGKRIAENLLKAGKPVVAVSRNAEHIQSLVEMGAKAAIGDLTDTDFLTRTFTGATAVYAMIPPNATASDFRGYQNQVGTAIVTALKNSGVKSVVTLSSVGAHSPETGVVAGLYDFEQQLKSLPEVNLLHLRPGFFMQNFLGNIGLIKGMGINGGFPIDGNLPVPMTHVHDIADVATEKLLGLTFTSHSHLYIYNASPTMAEATQLLGKAIGKPELNWVTFPYDQAKTGMVQMGFSESLADGYVQFSKATNEGILGGDVANGPQQKTPITFEAFAQEFAAAYQS
jgi:uncharacterized protein YbjT (DUF2867 family)